MQAEAAPAVPEAAARLCWRRYRRGSPPRTALGCEEEEAALGEVQKERRRSTGARKGSRRSCPEKCMPPDSAALSKSPPALGRMGAASSSGASRAPHCPNYPRAVRRTRLAARRPSTVRIVEEGNCERVAPAVCDRLWSIGLAARPMTEYSCTALLPCHLSFPSLPPSVPETNGVARALRSSDLARRVCHSLTGRSAIRFLCRWCKQL